jgi:lysine-N-methylase
MRRDQGPNRTLEPGRLASLRAGWRFARGSGLLPQVHRAVPAITFAQLEEPAGTLPDDAVALLERYYNTKVSSLQFFGAAHFGFGFWEGVEALCLTFPIVLWVSRALGQMPRNEALALAISMVDHNFGYNPALGSSRHRLSLRILGRRRELEKLTSWYSR